MSVDVCAYGYVTREWEVFPDGTSREITAGPPYFLAAALASLGDRVRVVTRVSREDEHILDELRRLGVDVVNLGTMRSMKSRIIYRESGERELEILSLARPFGLQDLDFCIRVSPRYIYLGPLTTQDFDLDFIRRARSRAQVVLDVQGFTRKVVGRRVVYVDWVWKLDAAPYVSILKLDDREGELLTGSREPEEIVRRAVEYGCSSISYTYTEPTIFFEYAYDTAEIAQGEGLKNTFVTNGFMTPEALEMISPYLDAANVDLKSFREDFYREVCSARLGPVLENIERMKALGIWVEVTTLVIPTLNDSEEELRQIARFIRSVGPEIPWHVTAFHPDYTMLDKPRTPVETLRQAREIGLEEGLRYVYSGNVPGDEGENTYCWNCHRMIIRRWGFQVLEKRIERGYCTFCGASIDGVGM